MSVSGLAASASLVPDSIVSFGSSTKAPDDANVSQLDTDGRDMDLDKNIDVDTILVRAESPDITLPKTSLITAFKTSLSGNDGKGPWTSTPLINSSAIDFDIKPQLKSISNIVQSDRTPNMCSSSKVLASNRARALTTNDGGGSQQIAKVANAKPSSKNHFRDTNIIKSSHYYNNGNGAGGGIISKPLVINHSTSVIDNIAIKSEIQPIISTLSSQLMLSSIITTQAQSQTPRASTLHLSNSTRTKLVMGNQSTTSSTSSSSSSSTSAATAATISSSTLDPAMIQASNSSKLALSTVPLLASSPSTGTAVHAVSAKLIDMGKKLLDAAREGNTDHVRQLVVNSGAPFTSDWLGTTALHLAAQYGHTEIAEILLRGGVNRDARTKLERTALHLAAQGGWIEVVDLLLIHGSDINVRDMLKMTPLHWSVERGHLAVVERLLFSGADANAKSKFQLTPIDIAQNSQSYEIMDLFRNWIHKSGNNLVSYIGLNNNLSESHEVHDIDYDHHLNLDDNATTSRNSMLHIDEPCIDLVELEWNAFKFEPDFFLSNDDEDEPKVEYLMKIVGELQKENRQLRQRVEQLSTTS